MEREREMDVSIQFLGGAGTVTGSKILLEVFGYKVLIDCGLFQGLKELRMKNRAPFPVDCSSIDIVLLTHAHLDHCGYLPVLVKNGFAGPVHCTYPTVELAAIILRDSGKIQEEEAERANRYGYTRHKPAKPIYTVRDAEEVMPLLTGHNYNEWVIVHPECKFRFLNAGHILGSAFVEIKVKGKTFLFSGDMGRMDPLLLYPPKKIRQCDFLILESTYGGRLHEETSPKSQLRSAIRTTMARGGVLLIPTFAVERAQEIIYLIGQLQEEGEMKGIPVYLDSPMGVNATEVMLRYPNWTVLSEKVCRDMCNAVDFITNAQASRAVVMDDRPKVVLAGSGMITGGRILHYLDKYIDRPETMVLLTGFQAAGTRGRALLEHAHEIKFFGRYRQVKAEVRHINSLSAHADQADIMDWLSNMQNGPEMAWINHGEPQQSDALRVKIKDQLGWKCETAILGKKYEL